MLLRKLFIVVFLCLPAAAMAQPPVHNNIASYTLANGLSHNTVNGLAQDATGYLWIATPAGVNRFNGSQFIQYHSSSDSLSLGSEDVTDMVWLNKNELAFYSAGLHIINTQTGKSRNLFIPYHRNQFQYKFNMVEQACGDEQGNKYVLSRSGFYHFDKNDKLVSRFDYYPEKQVPVVHFFFGRDLLQLDDRRLLIVSINGLYLYDKAARKIKKMTAEDSPLMAEFINYPRNDYQFLQQKPGNLFILKTQTDSLVFINVAENRKTVSRLPIKPLLNEFRYHSKLIPVNDTLFYLTGHSSGFFKMHFDPATGNVRLLAGKQFSAYRCNSLLTTRDKQLWIGTTKGLFRVNNERSRVEIATMPAELEASYPNIMLHEIFISGEKIYAGTRHDGHILVYDKRDMQYTGSVNFENYKKKWGKNFDIYSIIETTPSSFMVASVGPPLSFTQNNLIATAVIPPEWNIAYDWARELFKDSRGTVWISSFDVYRYIPGKGFIAALPPQLQVSSQILGPNVIREDASGNIWMAGHGLSRYNISLQQFDVRLDSFPFIKMPDKQISVMTIDKTSNTIWFDSKNNGLIAYDIQKGSFRHFTTANGLPDNDIMALVIVGNKLWVAGYSGLACIDLKTGQVTGFGKEDGFPHMPIGNGASFFYDSASQFLYLAYTRAIARFQPSEMLRRRSSPHVFIEELAIADQPAVFLPPAAVSTSWKKNEIRVTIGAINFSDAASQRYAFRIVKDANTPWTDMGTQPSFSISSLSNGSHRIQVKTYSLTNRWPEQVKEINLNVLPPFWEKPWFLTLAAILLVTEFYMMVRWRTSLARKKEMQKTHMEKLKADDYKNQFELEQISNYFSSSLTGKNTVESVLWDVASNLIGRINYEDCIIYMWNKDKTKMLQMAAYGPKATPGVISANAFEVEPGQGIVGHVIQTRQPLLVNDTTKDSRYRVDDQFRMSEIAVPIIHDDELLGVIDSENSNPGYFSERDIKILTTIATLIGNKIKQMESEQSLVAKQQELVGINEQLAEARLSALQAQMNPHFVFNALNSIKRMILDSDNDKASRYLSKFALMIRMTLEHSKQIFVTLDENIEYLQAYLDMEQLRFDDTFSYTITTDDNVDTTETFLPSMMIQPLVENAIWHGLMHAGGDKMIHVSFSQVQNKITCTVEDNGIGIQQSEKLRKKNRPLHRSVGLENLQKRIKIMNEKYDTACSLHIVDLNQAGLNGSGTRVTLQLNLINP